jgi:hypothetical protein
MFERGNPGSGASTDMVAAFFGVHRDALLAQSVLFLIGAGLLLWFVGGLRSYLIRAEGDSGRYSTLVFGAGVGYIALSVVAQASQVALAQIAGGTTSSELVAAVSVLSWALFTVAAVPVTVMLAAFAVLTLRTRAFPVWLGWLAALAAATQLGLLASIVADSGPMAPTGWYVYLPYPLYAGWLAATAVLMIRRAGRGRSTASSADALDQAPR